ncbi:hypothetical protein HPO96_26750 [Kribbella sandramycini]|uniref:Uncharacterized protein n=1 Tax=Kribbella sandramycini TaxID=60450 RepID=A0A7Y4L3V0_9ACTN|nr:Imm15 family immunity protein [Kribbella sandramycini]MBB6570710.1 hypothetical protein [Kribbella sandramycini]NOL43853.1 hypothetical protein [Kribbella sandramycini]
MTFSDTSFGADFERLFHENEVADPAVFAEVASFDEVPIYSRRSELAFLGNLSFAAKNRELILAAVRQLDRIHNYFEGSDESATIVRMVAVTGWSIDDEAGWRCEDGTTELIRPNLWLADLAHPDMADFRVNSPRSRCAEFVSQVIGAGPYRVFESRPPDHLPDCPARVYIARSELLGLLPVADH